MGKQTAHQREVGRIEIQERGLAEASSEAWARKAELEQKRAADSFRVQLFRKTKIGRDDYELDLDYFEDEFHPRMRMAAVIDGIVICLSRDGELAMIQWECEKAKCTRRLRGTFNDLSQLGQKRALCEHEAETHPDCKSLGQRCTTGA